MSKEEIEGIATNVHERVEEQGIHILTVLLFRIEITDSSGNPAGIIPVEMRGVKFSGDITEGDMVRVKGKMKDGILNSKEAYNFTTNSKVKAK